MSASHYRGANRDIYTSAARIGDHPRPRRFGRSIRNSCTVQAAEISQLYREVPVGSDADHGPASTGGNDRENQ
jgi:hypothetical protein